MKINKFLKFVFTINMIISTIVVVYALSRGMFMSPVEDIKAVQSPTKYMVSDTVIVNNIRYNIRDGETTPENYRFCIDFRLSNGKKKEIYYYQDRYKINLIKEKDNDKMIILRNVINDNIFLDDKEYIKYKSISNYFFIYFYISFLISIILISIYKIYVHQK